ncbi:LptF/LptG family permease [Candidatus Pelagibacter sp.]|nr:LptF/LptG family permease [Candidatus Pelagibacter sp.]
MKKLIFQKFLKDLITFFLLVSLSIALIVWVIQAVNFLDFISEDGHGFKVYFYYTVLNLPKIFSRILPFIFFVSLFYTILKYENNNELIIFWTTGIKKIQFTNTMIKFSIFFLLIQLILTAFIVPKSQDLARSFIRSSNIDLFPSLIKEKTFVDTVSDLTIFIDSKNEDGELKNIFLKDDFSNTKSQIIYAKSGNLITDLNKNYLILYDGSFINNDNGKITNFSFKKTEFNLSRYTTKSTTFPKIQELNTLLLANCLKYIFDNNSENFFNQYLQCDPDKTIGIKQELFKRLFVPFYIILISLISTLVLIKSKDDFNFNKFKYTVFIIGVMTLVLSEISTRYSGINNLYSGLSIGVPIFLFLTVYLTLSNKFKVKNSL